MALSSSDIIVYGSANMQSTDSGTQGGAIDTTARILLDSDSWANNINDNIKIRVNAAGDAGLTVTVYGRNISGQLISESIWIPGVPIYYSSTLVYKEILKITTSKSNINTVNIAKVSDGSILYVMQAATRKLIRPFYNASSDISTGSQKEYYEKIFVKNTNSTDALLNAVISDGGGDSNGYITFALEDTIDGTNSSTNRITTPSNLGSSGFSSSAKNLLTETGTNDLLASKYIGIWLKLTLPAGASAEQGFWKLNISGSIK